MAYKSFDKKSSGDAVKCANKSAIKSEILSSYQLPKELHKPNIRKLEKRKVYSSFKDSVWGAELSFKKIYKKIK